MSVSKIIFYLAMAYLCSGEDSSESSRDTVSPDEKTNDEDVPQQPQKEEGNVPREKFVIPYVPDYPSR